MDYSSENDKLCFQFSENASGGLEFNRLEPNLIRFSIFIEI